MPKINFSNVTDEQNSGFTPLAEGKYVLTVEKCEADTTKNGNECFNLVFTIGDTKRKVFDTLYFTEKALNRVKKACSCLGVACEGEVDLTPEQFIGKSCNGYLVIRDYTGKDGTAKQTNDVNWWMSEKGDTIVGTQSIPF